MKIVVAPDKFKGSLTAAEAARAIANGVHPVLPHAQLILHPLADGGDGTAAVLYTALGGEWIERRVTGPLPKIPGSARYLWLARTRWAVIEMAAASGLALVPAEQRDPLRTTSYGTGELIRDALDRAARRLWLGVGGSATVDGGVGAAMALGWKFLNAAGQPVGLGGGALRKITRILPPANASHLPPSTCIEVLCDVDNPLCGPHGAARMFGPQKGATPAMVEELDDGLAHLAGLVREQLGRDLATLPGAGAAGGLGFGAAAFLGARLVGGAEKIMELTSFDDALRGADWVITGEGCYDEQSARGKVVSVVLQHARQHGVKVALLAGRLAIPNPPGFALARAVSPVGMPLAEALARAAELLTAAARDLAIAVESR